MLVTLLSCWLPCYHAGHLVIKSLLVVRFMEADSHASYGTLPLNNRSQVCAVSKPSSRETKVIRLVDRSSGRSQIKHVGLYQYKHSSGFVKDSFTTLANLDCVSFTAVFSFLHCGSWLLFGCLWYMLNQSVNYECLENVHDFTESFLFSAETQLTIGFGSRWVSSDCYVGIALLVVQMIFSTGMGALLCGILYARSTSPRSRRSTFIFSKNAVIRKNNGNSIFQFRIGNLRRDAVVECHVRLQLYLFRGICNRYQLEQYDLDVGYSTGRDRLFLLTPVVITHYITPDSPLYNFSQRDLAETDFEVVVVLEGAVEATGLTAQALWSYKNHEIVFDKIFVPIESKVETRWKRTLCEVDFSRFDKVS